MEEPSYHPLKILRLLLDVVILEERLGPVEKMRATTMDQSEDSAVSCLSD
jgi:hypothetical protein